ncbi:glycosyltransferase [Micromonospora sp. WMMC415]|uniref:glycosyltransferase n=1 Tax=Micromonospora sp. WMMC415 TaxID=2675222 RepID=UPI0012B4F367|nr:nucleotide disphospho-sugar-binding domain-containing protein [Micromonospora sp. WMMC415]QGN46952.1 glycosyltransferase [Micromonospora sp. WMMC415]
MRVLFFNNPINGHFLPLLPLARALRKRGHSVAFVSAAGMAAAVEAEGFELIAAGPTAGVVIDELARRTGTNILVSRTPELVGEFFAGVRVDLAVDEALAGSRAWRPDLVVSEHLDFVGPLVAAMIELPSAAVAIDPALEPGSLAALAVAARSRYLSRGLAAPDHVPSGRWLLDLCPPSLQRGGALPPLDHIALRPEPHQAPDGAPRAARVPGTGRPRVLVSLSTAPGAPSALGPVLRSLSALDVDLVAATGGRPAEEFGLEPGRVELFSFVPAAELLDGVTAVVHHGGSGTTFGTAARGLPAVVVPGTEGQERQAKRVEAAGAGLALPIGEQEPSAVAAALARLLTEPAFTVAAQRLSDEIAAMPSASEVAERLVAYVSESGAVAPLR